MIETHIKVDGCLVLTPSGLTAITSFVPKAQLPAQMFANVPGACHRTDSTLEELQALRGRLMQWVESVDMRIAAFAVQHPAAAVAEAEQPAAASAAEPSSAEEQPVAESPEELTLEQMAARLKKEREAAATAARRKLRIERFNGLPIGTPLRNRQKISASETDLRDCTKAAGPGWNCTYNGAVMQLKVFANKHRQDLKDANRISRAVAGDPLQSLMYFHQGNGWRLLAHD
jgi:hypothetical protein